MPTTRNSIDTYLESLRQNEGSDLHISPGIPPRIRVDGKLQPLRTDPLSDAAVRTLIEPLMDVETQERFRDHKSVDFAYDAGELGRFRVNAFVQLLGAGAVFRMIPARIPSADEINLPPAVQRLADLHSGLLLVTGPTGSGKSTTLAAMVDLINCSRAGHIITVEDPIEFTHESKNCIVSHREIGTNVNNYPDALRAALREDPDVIVVGEMRDPTTIQLAITAAETGHLVLGTLHTYSAMKAVDRIIDTVETDRQTQVRNQLAEILRAVIAQQLVPLSAGKGRIAAHEILLNNTAVANNIRRGEISAIESAMGESESGMQTMERALASLVVSGLINLEVGRTAANAPDKYDQYLRSFGWEPARIQNPHHSANGFSYVNH